MYIGLFWCMQVSFDMHIGLFCYVCGTCPGPWVHYDDGVVVFALLQCVAVCCSVLQSVAVCYSVLQYVQCVAVLVPWVHYDDNLVIVALLQCDTVRCKVLQCVAVCCSVLQ